MKEEHIYEGDCISILNQTINPGSVNLTFADPPYNLSGKGLSLKGNKTGGDWYMVNESWDKMSDADYLIFTREWLSGCHRVLTDNGAIYVSCTYHNIAEIMTTLRKLNFKIRNVITWQKTNPMPSITRRTFTHSSEFIIWATKGIKWVFNYEEIKNINPDRQKMNGNKKQMRDVWSIPSVQGRERIKGDDGRASHPTQKPMEILRRIIIASSHEGDLILDPFMGSGTTAVVSEKLRRRWIGVEKEPKYIKVAEKRIKCINVLSDML